MLNLFQISGVSMIIGSILMASSGVMVTIGKFFIDPRVKDLESAKEIRDDSQGGYGFVEGPLHTDHPIEYGGEQYVRLDESIYHITSTRVVGYDINTKQKRSEFEKKPEFMHRTIKHAKPVFINNINIGSFIHGVGLKKIGVHFAPIHEYVQNNSGQYTNISLKVPIGNDNLLGEHERQVIGIEHRASGIKASKKYTIFGHYNEDKQKMTKSKKHHNVITKLSRDQFIAQEKSFASGWKFIWGCGFVVGCAVSTIGFVAGRQ